MRRKDMQNAAELHRALFEAITSKDFDKIRELFHPDCIYMVGDGTERKGVEVPLNSAEMFTNAFPDLTIDIRRQYTPSDTLSITEYIFSGTHKGELEGTPATGKKIAVVACSVMKARDGRIIREHDYYDNMAIMSQLGLSGGS